MCSGKDGVHAGSFLPPLNSNSSIMAW